MVTGSGEPWQVPRGSSAADRAGRSTAGRQLPRSQAETPDSSSPGSLCPPGPGRASRREEPDPRRLLLRPPRLSAPQPPTERSRHRRPCSSPAVRRVGPAAARLTCVSAAILPEPTPEPLPEHFRVIAGPTRQGEGLAPPGGRAAAARSRAGGPGSRLFSVQPLGRCPAAPASLGIPDPVPSGGSRKLCVFRWSH